MKKKTILSIVVLLVIVLGIFGITKFVGAEGNAEGETLVVTHESGETTVNKNPKRVVVFDYGILDSLDKLGVEEIDTTNGFDPNLHQAISVVEDENLNSNDVAQVYQKGYKKGEKVIRYSMVTVAK